MMSQTLSQWAAQDSLLLVMVCSALLIFFLFFVTLVVRTYRKTDADHYEALGRLPLQAEVNS